MRHVQELLPQGIKAISVRSSLRRPRLRLLGCRLNILKDVCFVESFTCIGSWGIGQIGRRSVFAAAWKFRIYNECTIGYRWVEMKSGTAKLVASIKSILSQPLNAILLKSLLADVRKLLETTAASDMYPTLKFHCDWVLHTRMSRKFASELLRRADEVFDKTMNGSLMPPEFAKELTFRAGFIGFIKELRQFLARFKIVIVQIENDISWLPLERMYYGIVEDAFLEYTPKKKEQPLRRINGARARMFSLADTTDYPDTQAWYLDQPEAILPYGVEWTFTKDGEDIFKLTATAMLPTYVEREIEKMVSPNPEYTLLHCWPQQPTQPH